MTLLTSGLMVVAHYVAGVYQGLGYPYNTPFFRGDDVVVEGQPTFFGHFFGDFWLTVTQSGDDSPYIGHSGPIPSPYFPFAHVLLRPLAEIPLGVGLALYLGAFLLVAASVVFVAASGLEQWQRIRLAVLLGLFSYPVLFVVDRGNFEGVVFAFVAVAVWAQERNPWLCATAIALGAAIKPFPLVLVALLIAGRRFGPAVLAVGLTLVLTVASSATFEGGARKNLEGLRDSLQNFETINAGTAGLQHASDILGTVIALTAGEEASRSGSLTLVSMAILAAAALWVIFARPPAVPAASVLLIAMVVAPHPAFDYRLVHLLIPATLFLRHGYGSGNDAIAAVAWALALAPMGLPVLFADVSIGIVVRPILLCALAALIVVTHHRLRAPAPQELPRGAVANA